MTNKPMNEELLTLEELYNTWSIKYGVSESIINGCYRSGKAAGRTEALAEVKPIKNRLDSLKEAVLEARFGTKNRVELLQYLETIIDLVNEMDKE
jgi:Zn-finger domain-containing protein